MRVKEYENAWVDGGKIAIDLDKIVGIMPFSKEKTRLFTSDGADFTVLADYKSVFSDWVDRSDTWMSINRLVRIEAKPKEGILRIGNTSFFFDCGKHIEAYSCLRDIEDHKVENTCTSVNLEGRNIKSSK